MKEKGIQIENLGKLLQIYSSKYRELQKASNKGIYVGNFRII
jgi:hypothetical protein